MECVREGGVQVGGGLGEGGLGGLGDPGGLVEGVQVEGALEKSLCMALDDVLGKLDGAALACPWGGSSYQAAFACVGVEVACHGLSSPCQGMLLWSVAGCGCGSVSAHHWGQGSDARCVRQRQPGFGRSPMRCRWPERDPVRGEDEQE